MKKSFAILAAAACALSVTAFAACGGDENSDDLGVVAEEVWEAVAATDSDVVSAEVWAAAFDEANFLNVTVAMAYTYTEYDMGTYNEVGVMKSKTALTEDSSGYITGNSYLYRYEEDDDGDAEGEEIYEVFESDSYSSVEKFNYNGHDEGEYEHWYGDYTTYAGTVSDSYAYLAASDFGAGYGLGQYTEYVFDQFIYKDGAYVDTYTYSYNDSTYSETYSATYYVKINDGYISSLVIEESHSSTGGTYDIASEETKGFIFTDYGTTTVTVPTEFTFVYYLENYYRYYE